MKLSYKYRLYPNTIQRLALDDMFYHCRSLYNSALQERISFYKKYSKDLSYAKQCLELTELKELHPEFANIYSQTLQQVVKQVDTAFKNFFRRVRQKADQVGFPRYKGQDRLHSILFPQPKPDLSGGGVKRLASNKLAVFGIPGELNVWWHRPWQGRCKQVRITKDADKFYLVLSCDEVPLAHLPPTEKSVGIDLGINTFIVGDDGLEIHHPMPLKRNKARLSRKQRELSKKKKGSRNRRRAIQDIARAHQRVSNTRLDFLHKTAARLVQEYDIIVLEKLNIKSMLEAKGFEVNSGNIADASWGIFVQILIYKAERAGRKLIFVDPYNTSKTCSCCGKVHQDLTLKDRTFHCKACGLSMDRDRNAAINIKRLGLSLVVKATALSQKPLPQCAFGA